LNLVSSYSTFSNNTCNNNYYGFHVGSLDVNVTNTTLKNNQYGMSIYAQTAVVSNNTYFNNTYYGLNLNSHSLYNMTITNNNFTYCGLTIATLSIEKYYNLKIENNLVNNKKLGYFLDSSNITITEPLFGQLLLVNCSNIMISKQNLSYIPSAIRFLHCDNVTLTENVFYKNDCSIFVFNTNNVSLINNTITFSDSGLVVSISNNTIILNNTFTNNQDGMRINNAYNITIANNTMNYNSLGMHLGRSENISVIFNTFMENSYFAVEVVTCTNSSYIHHNNFINNYPEWTSQAIVISKSCLWYNPSNNEGNYWSDWSGIGEYIIDGTAEATDPYPLSNPVV